MPSTFNLFHFHRGRYWLDNLCRSYPTDAQTAFGAAQAKMTAPGGAMMANAVNPTQQQQQMMYAAHQSQIVMQQQQQQQQQTSNQFLSMGGPQTTQSFQRLTPQQVRFMFEIVAAALGFVFGSESIKGSMIEKSMLWKSISSISPSVGFVKCRI